MTNSNHETVQFVQNHLPTVKSGEYTINIGQTIKVNSTQKLESNQSKTFYVASERFAIKPQEIHSYFPPPHNNGHHSNVLPHITLNRSTLPWERSSGANDELVPWLWLFIFSEDEVRSGKVSKPQLMEVDQKVCFIDTNGNAVSGQNADISYKLEQEPSEDIKEHVKILTVNGSWLNSNNMVPTPDALKLLTSVRVNKENDTSMDWAICVANRMPKAGKKSYAHLVSMEHRYNKTSFDFVNNTDNDGNINFVSLANWTFSCPMDNPSTSSNTGTFKSLLENLTVGNFQIQSCLENEDGIQEANQYISRGGCFVTASITPWRRDKIMVPRAFN